MYNPTIFGEWQRSGKICYLFCRSIRATMWLMIGRYKGNKRTGIVVRFRAEVGIWLWQMAQVELTEWFGAERKPCYILCVVARQITPIVAA